MDKYVDGFLIPVPKENLDSYLKMAALSGSVWMEHGALEYTECIADDVQPGKVTSFPQSVLMKEDETVIFSWISYRSREHRDEVNKKAMADPRLAHMKPEDFPFDGKRLIWGGFRTIVALGT
ncbi:MAG: DUF1428 domain-containing protein [Woeseia sp.]